MTPDDLVLRNSTYAFVAEHGRVPRSDELSPWPRAQVREGWRRLHDAHALVLDAGGEIRMANPFSAVPTAYRVDAGGRSWFGNCAWDAVGICAALHVDGVVETRCADCDDPIRVEVREQQPQDAGLVFHCLVPAARWWDDIAFT